MRVTRELKEIRDKSIRAILELETVTEDLANSTKSADNIAKFCGLLRARLVFYGFSEDGAESVVTHMQLK